MLEEETHCFWEMVVEIDVDDLIVLSTQPSIVKADVLHDAV